MNSGIAKHDKMEVLPRNTACHRLSCWIYWYINKYVSRPPLCNSLAPWTLKTSPGLLVADSCTQLLNFLLQLPWARFQNIAYRADRGYECKPTVRWCEQQLSQDCSVLYSHHMIMVKKPAKLFLQFSSTIPLFFKCQNSQTLWFIPKHSVQDWPLTVLATVSLISQFTLCSQSGIRHESWKGHKKACPPVQQGCERTKGWDRLPSHSGQALGTRNIVKH